MLFSCLSVLSFNFSLLGFMFVCTSLWTLWASSGSWRQFFRASGWIIISRRCSAVVKKAEEQLDFISVNVMRLLFLSSSSPSLSPWECAHCTTVNEMRAVLCTTCERPRLATAASTVQESPMSVPTSPNTGETKTCRNYKKLYSHSILVTSGLKGGKY